MIGLCQRVKNLVDLLWIMVEFVILQVELDLLNGFGEHEFVLAHFKGLALLVCVEIFVNLNDFFEIQLFEIYVQPSDQKINHVTLLQFVIVIIVSIRATLQRSQCFQYITYFPIKLVKIIHFCNTHSIPLDKINIIDD